MADNDSAQPAAGKEDVKTWGDDKSDEEMKNLV